MFNRGAKRLKIESIITQAVTFGLSLEDLQEVNLLVSHREYEVAIDHIATQLFEYDATISESFYEEVMAYIKFVGLKDDDYTYLSECIK